MSKWLISHYGITLLTDVLTIFPGGKMKNPPVNLLQTSGEMKKSSD